MKLLIRVCFTDHNSPVVLADEDASTVMVVGHAGARSYNKKRR